MAILLHDHPASGGPGIEPRWTRSDKHGVGDRVLNREPGLVHRLQGHAERGLPPDHRLAANTGSASGTGRQYPRLPGSRAIASPVSTPSDVIESPRKSVVLKAASYPIQP